MKFGTRVHLKSSNKNDRGEFELNRTTSKNNIAEKSVALGHEKHNRLSLGQCSANTLVFEWPDIVENIGHAGSTLANGRNKRWRPLLVNSFTAKVALML